jgi:hypothetical protein
LWKIGSQAARKNTTANAGISANASWITVKMKVTAFYTSSLGTECGCTTNTTIQR